jgi:hypothetical protein
MLVENTTNIVLELSISDVTARTSFPGKSMALEVTSTWTTDDNVLSHDNTRHTRTLLLFTYHRQAEGLTSTTILSSKSNLEALLLLGLRNTRWVSEH